LCCSQNGDHPESNLAKSGYNLDMKVGKKKEKENRIFLYSWLILELIIKIWRFGGEKKS
jgi:hypothetical protein